MENGSAMLDLENVEVHPSIQIRIDRLRRRQAERDLEKAMATAISAVDSQNRVVAENKRLKQQNCMLLQQVHAAAGWPVRLALPSPVSAPAVA